MGEVLLGASGWDYPEWVGRVYPRRAAIDRLHHYAQVLPIVEVNTTFYRLPPVSVVESFVTFVPFTAVIVSPATIPARDAGLELTTASTN